MSETKSCPKCGAALPSATTAGLCPRCLMAEAMSQTEPNAKAAALSPEELAPHFPQLEILELIGKGGMGAVYKARQKELDRLVAVKILPCGMGVPPSFAERFAREAKALAKLNHPNIVAIHEFGRADGLFYFVMEYVDGVNLRQLLRAGRVAPREALAIVPLICDALQYAHDAGIVHRDIKPENILLDRQGRVKIADFGIAKMMEGRDEPPTRLKADAGDPAGRPYLTEVAGTPQYMAPEQKDRCRTDHRADIYSLGVVLYEMLTGELPGKPIEPPSRKIQIDVRLDEVVLRALEKEPERRYQTAAEVKTMVETIVTTPAGASSEPTNKSGMVRLTEIFFGITFMSRLAVKLVNVSALGFLASLGFLGYLPIPGWQRCFGFFGFSGFFGLIGVAFVIEMAARSKRGDTSLRSIIVVGRRDGKAVIHWPGVFLGFFLALVVLEVVAVVASLAMEERINANAILIAFFSALMITGIRIRRGRTMPVDQLISLDEPLVAAPSKGGTPTVGVPASAGSAAALQQVKGPAIGLLVTGMLNWIVIPLILMIMLYLAAGFHGQPTPSVLIVLPIAALVLCTVMIFGALKMKRLESYGWAIAAAILAILVSPGNIIGLPLGIWALLVLRRPDVRAAFQRGGVSADSRGRIASWFARRGRMLLLRDLPVAIVIVFVLRAFVIQNYRAETDAVSPEIPRGSWMLVYKLARTFQPGDIVAYRHGGKVFAGRVAEAGPNDGILRVQRKEKSPAFIAAADIIGKVIFNTRAGRRDNITTVQSSLRAADMTQDTAKDIQPDGTIRFKTTITKRNTSSEPLQTLRFYNSDFVKVEKLTDAQGRTIPFTVTRAGNITLRYQATLPEPVQPGVEHSYVMEGTETGLVKRLLESDVFEYTMRHWPGTTSRTRRIELHRLPAGAQLLNKQPNDLVARTRDGIQELFIDRLIPTGDSLEISYTYRVPAKP